MQRSDWWKKDAWLESSTRSREVIRGDWVKRRGANGKRGRRCRKEREREETNEKGSSVYGIAQEKNT